MDTSRIEVKAPTWDAEIDGVRRDVLLESHVSPQKDERYTHSKP